MPGQGENCESCSRTVRRDVVDFGSTSIALRFFSPSGEDPLKGVADSQATVVKVHVGPGETKGFPEPKTKREYDGEQGVQPVIGCGGEKGTGFGHRSRIGPRSSAREPGPPTSRRSWGRTRSLPRRRVRLSECGGYADGS